MTLVHFLKLNWACIQHLRKFFYCFHVLRYCAIASDDVVYVHLE